MKDGGRRTGRRKARKENEEADSDVLVGSIVRRTSRQYFFIIGKLFHECRQLQFQDFRQKKKY